LLAPLSTELNKRAPDEKLNVTASLRDGKPQLSFNSENAFRKRSSVNNVLAAQAERIAELRRRMQKFLASYKLTELTDELYRIGRLQATILRGKWVSDEDRTRIERQPKIEKFLENVRAFGENVNSFEDEILLEIYGKAASENRKQLPAIERKESLLQDFLFELLRLQYMKPDEIKLTFFSENQTALQRLLRLYSVYFKDFGGEIRRLMVFTSEKQPAQEAEKIHLFDREVWRREIVGLDKFPNALPDGTVGLLAEIEGDLALARLGAESGIHRFVAGLKSDRVLVGTTGETFEKFRLFEDLIKRDSVKFQFERRTYMAGQNQVKDSILDKTFSLENAKIEEVFVKAIEENLINISVNLI
jgi:hypothetical protein